MLLTFFIYSKGGFFNRLMKDVDKVGRDIGRELDNAGKKINETVDKNYTSSLLVGRRAVNRCGYLVICLCLLRKLEIYP